MPFLKDFHSQFIWWAVASGLCIKLWQMDSGQYGIFFVLSFVPFAFINWLYVKWDEETKDPGIWQMLRDDKRLDDWPRLKRLIRGGK